MQIILVALIGIVSLLILVIFKYSIVAISFVTGMLFCGLFLWIVYYFSKNNRLFSTLFSSDLFQHLLSAHGIKKFRQQILSKIKNLQDYQIFFFNNNDITIFPKNKIILTKEEKITLELLVQKSLHKSYFVSVENLDRIKIPNSHCYAYSYSLPFFNKRILILVYISADTPWSPLLQEQISSANDTLSVVSFLVEVIGGNEGILELLKESVWGSPYAVGVCNPAGELFFGNDALYQMFQGDVPNFSVLTGKEVFMLLFDGKRIGQSFTLQGRRIQLEAFPLNNKNFLVTKCLFVFFDESVEFKQEMLGEANTLKRFTSGSSLIGSAMFTLDGIILYSNEAFMKKLDVYKVREAVQKNIFELFIIDKEEYQRLVTEILLGTEQQISLIGKENEQEFQVLFKGVIFGDKTIVEVVLEDDNIYNANMSYLDKETQELYEELKTARSVQEHILTLPTIYRPGMGVNTLYIPSRQLSGDFFTIIPFENDQMGILIADVSGHGVSASLITAALKILIEFAPRDADSLPKIMFYFNTYLAGILPEGSFVTLFYGIIDFNENTLQYINSGHPFPILEDIERNEIKILEGMGYPLGGLLNVSFEDLVHTVQLPAKCRILLYTDGILQHIQGTMKEKLEKIWYVIGKNKALNDKELLHVLYQDLISRNSPIPEDDVSMMLVSLDKTRTMKHHLYISSSILEVDIVIAQIGIYIQKVVELDPAVYWKIQTCFYESLLNAVVHGNKYNTQKKVYIEFRIVKGLIVIRIRDEGIGFNYNHVPDPLNPENILKDFGRGITVLKTLTDKVKFNKSGNEVTMFFKTEKGK